METIIDELKNFVIPVSFLGSVILVAYFQFVEINNIYNNFLLIGSFLIFFSSILRFFGAISWNEGIKKSWNESSIKKWVKSHPRLSAKLPKFFYKEKSPEIKRLKEAVYFLLLVGMTMFFVGLLFIIFFKLCLICVC